MSALAHWSAELGRITRHDEHPWNEGLMLDALLASAARAMAPRAAADGKVGV